MIPLGVAKPKLFSPESVFFLWIKPKKKKKNFFVEILDQCLRLELRKRARNVFFFSDEPTSVWPQGVTQHRIFIKFIFRFRPDFLAFIARISHFKFLELKELNKTIIPLARVGYGTGYSQLGATCLVGYICYVYVLRCYSYVLVCTRMLLVCTRMLLAMLLV